MVDGSVMKSQMLVAPTLGLVLMTAVIGIAHEVTYRGTVVALQTSKYAQPGGGFREVQELEVSIVDARTKRRGSRVFTISERTGILRDKKRVSLADAAVRKGDGVEVVIDHDKPGDEAIEIRLTTAR
jgi:hypothetical protein